MADDLTDADYERLLLFRTSLRRFLRWSQEQAAAVGMTAAHHQLVLAVRGHPDERGPTIGDVADYLQLRHHSAVGLVDRAANCGLVVRVEDPADSRVVRLELTPLARAQLTRLSAAHLEELSRLGARLAGIWTTR